MDPSIGGFTCSGGKKSSVNGTFAYINLFLSPSVPSERRLFHESFQWVLTAEGEKPYLFLSMETEHLPVTFCGKIFSAVALPNS